MVVSLYKKNKEKINNNNFLVLEKYNVYYYLIVIINLNLSYYLFLVRIIRSVKFQAIFSFFFFYIIVNHYSHRNFICFNRFLQLFFLVLNNSYSNLTIRKEIFKNKTK